MVKSIQIKTVMIFAILGILVITALGIFYIYQLEYIEQIVNSDINNNAEIGEALNNQMQNTKMVIYYSLGIFSIVSIIVGIVLSRIIVSPISKLIKSAELIMNSKPTQNINILKNGKKANEIDDLINAFSLMNNELKENLNEVSRQKKQIETILLNMTDGIIAFDIEGNIIHINPVAKDYLNIKDENSFNEIFDKFNVDINLEKVIYLENWTSSEQKLNVDGRHVNLFFAPFKNENERPAGVIVVIQDITEHVKLDSMRKEFVADVSHELKTPITSIMGYSDTLIENEVDKETENKFLERISSEAKRMSQLVSDLLILSRYDSSKIKVEKTEFDLGELVKYTLEGLKFELEKKKLKTECFVTADVPYVYADKNGIERVILNILTNAIKYTNENGEIKIYVGFVYNDAYIKVIDNGIGIKEDDLNKIFERFYRVDKSRAREQGGTGLGLSIAKEILDKNDGKIDIKSEYGKGTEVVIRLTTKQKKEKDKDKDKEEKVEVGTSENKKEEKKESND